MFLMYALFMVSWASHTNSLIRACMGFGQCLSCKLEEKGYSYYVSFLIDGVDSKTVV